MTYRSKRAIVSGYNYNTRKEAEEQARKYLRPGFKIITRRLKPITLWAGKKHQRYAYYVIKGD